MTLIDYVTDWLLIFANICDIMVEPFKLEINTLAGWLTWMHMSTLDNELSSYIDLLLDVIGY